MISRRELLALAPGLIPACAAPAPPLDRHAIVARHNPSIHAPEPASPLSVGNGEFAFTADFTGLQSFPQLYDRAIPLCTQSQWGWHSFPLPSDLAGSTLRLEMFDVKLDAGSRQAGYPTSAKGQERLFNWLRENPHRLNLARIGLLLDGLPLVLDDVKSVDQQLDLWSAALTSRFELRGVPVKVITCCHPQEDALAVFIESPLLERGRLTASFEFPYGSTNITASDWNSPGRHQTQLRSNAQSAEIERQLDQDAYVIQLAWNKGGQLQPASPDAAGKPQPHRLVLSGAGPELNFVCRFAARHNPAPLPSASATRAAAASHWARFWSTGAAIDLSGSRDARAPELERRIVLSQYLTAIQCAGSMPPQETGLTCNSWFGKFHLEMHWWHAAHFPLWDRAPLLERSLAWYSSILPSARERSRQQGYSGSRWPKMTAPDGRDSPSPIGPLLVWQQPHPIAMAELCYRSHPNRETLRRYREIVQQSAEFLASFAVERGGRYVLGPPVIPAQENHPPRETWNPTFELAYFSQALDIAQTWRERLGMARHPKWDDVRARLSKLPVKDGVYLAHENCPQTFTERNRDHPSMLAAFGVLRGDGVDRETMRRTLKRVFSDWKWPDTWGWDFPMVAMTAARVGEPALAIDALFIESPKNTWLPNGHNSQRANLPLYLPGNGGLLAAVAMMAGGWRDAPAGNAPGFPADWNVRAEGFNAFL